MFNRVPLLDWEGVISGEAFFLIQAASVGRGGGGREGGGGGTGCPINAKSQRRIAAVWFREIKFMINLIGWAQHSGEVVLSILMCILGLLA